MSLVAIFQCRSASTSPSRIKIRRRLLGRCAPIVALGIAGGLLSIGMVFAPSAHASTYTWDGTVNDWLAAPSHWGSTTPGTFPGTTDDAKNLTAAAMTLGQSTTIQSFFSNGAFSLNGGTFTGFLASAAGTIQVNALFTLNGGQISNFTVQQGTGGSVVVTGSGGNQIIDSILNSNLDMDTNVNANVDLYGTVTENGAITLGTTSNGIRLVSSNTSLNIGSAGSLTGFGSVYQYNANTLSNGGTINANSSGQSLNLALTNFTNSGTAKATSGGTLALASTNVTNNGTLAAFGLGSVVALTGTITNGVGSLFTTTGGGQIQVNGAILSGTITTDSATALTYNGSGGNQIVGATVNGNLDLATNANAYVDLYGTVIENGAITLGTTSNGIRLVSVGTSLNIGSAGSLTGFGSVYQYNANTLSNGGTINANSSGQSLNLALTTFNNNKIAEATNSATLNLNNTSTNNNAGSTLVAKSGGIINFNGGTFTADAASTLDGAGGTFNVNGANLIGTLNGTAGTSLIFNGSSGNTLNNGTPAGTIETVNTNLDLATNANAYVDLYGTVIENGAITLGTTSNGIRLVSSNTSLNIGSLGSLTGFGSVYQYNANTLSNGGTINANSSGQSLNLALTTFNNNGTTKAINGATLNLNNTNTNNNAGSTLVAKSGGTVNIGGTFTADAASTLDGAGGTFNVVGANLIGTLNGTVGTSLIFNGGSNTLNNGTPAGTIETINTNLDFATNVNANVDLYGTVTENGAITLGTTSNGIRLVSSNTSLNIGSAGSLTGFGSVYQYNANTLNNGGTINANSAGNTLNINTTSFTNTGTAEVQNGAFLSVTGANTDSGNVLVSTGGTATFGQGLTQTAGTTQVDGTLNSAITLTGGTLKGTGTVVGNVVNNGGTIAPGDSPGKLSITGAFTQNSGTFSIEFNNTAHDLLAVSGLVTTGGILDVNYVGTGASTGVGSIFDILDYGSVATSLTGSQFFSNQGPAGLITGHDGFTYMLINDTVNNQLQLKELTAGNPVPETSSVVSLGLLLALGLGGLTVGARRRSAVH